MTVPLIVEVVGQPLPVPFSLHGAQSVPLRMFRSHYDASDPKEPE